MKKIAPPLLLSAALTLGACNQLGMMGQQWLDPDHTFASMDQPSVKGVNETQEDMAKEAMKNADYARAAEFYQQLVSSKKGTPEQVLRYKLGLAESVRRLGKTENAQELYDELFAENPKNLDVAEGRALTLMANGKTADAGRAFSDVLEKDPKRWRTLNALGILFVTKDMIPESMAYYTEALKQSPDNSAVLNNVGLSQAIDKKFPRAIDALQQASRVSKSPAQRKQIDLNLAMVYGVSGDLDTARDVAGKYYEGAALDNNLGLYAHLAKDDALAKSYLNMALTQSPTYYERAWENLDVVNDTSRSDGDASGNAETPPANAKLPKTDPLRNGAAKHKTVKNKMIKQTDAEPVPQSSDAKMIPAENPAIRSEDKQAQSAAESKNEKEKDARDKSKASDKPAADTSDAGDKPAGLIVGPSE